MPPRTIAKLPSKARKIYEETSNSLRGKTNPRTGKVYTGSERGMISWTAVKRKYKKVGEKWVEKS